MDMHSDVKYACNTCDKSFSRKDVLKKHEKTHGPTNFWCFPCDKTFKTGDSLREHVQIAHEFVRFHCTNCPKNIHLWPTWKSTGLLAVVEVVFCTKVVSSKQIYHH